MNLNPMQMVGMLMNGGKGMNPMNLMMNQLNSNPMFRQAQQMVQGKSPEELKQTCENLCKQRGINFDDAWTQFQSQFPGLK